MAAKKSNAPTAEELAQMRHSAAHVLAEAVLEMFPEAKYAIGPPIDTGFYYDFDLPRTLTPNDLKVLQKRMKKSVKKNLAITGEQISKKDAKKIFASQPYKLELIEDIEEETVGHFTHGSFEDLCRGGHAASTGQIGAFELTHVAGAYWKGDENNPMLQRVYGALFATDDELQAYLKAREEAAERDHRRLGRELDLFFLDPLSPGSPFFLPGGTFVVNELTNYLRELYIKYGYDEVITPQLFSSELWKTSGHYENFQGDMFLVPIDDQEMGIKPMNCPGHIQVFNQGLKSYRDLPLRITEFGKVHRYEPSGALHGLLRVRAFTQDDAHIFCSEDQITSECLEVTNLILDIYKDLGFENVILKYADRPEVRVGEDKVWDKAEASLLKAVKESKLEYSINKGEGAFYGPKIEFVLRDAIGRDWQCGTLQVDLNLPGRLDASYVDKDGTKKVPVMLHRALFGSLERFIGILIENYAGKFPFWISPLQTMIIPISEEFNDYAVEVSKKIKSAGISSSVDLKNNNLNYKIRDHSLAKIPLLLICGKKEVDSNSVTIRRLDSNKQENMDIDQFLKTFSALNKASSN